MATNARSIPGRRRALSASEPASRRRRLPSDSQARRAAPVERADESCPGVGTCARGTFGARAESERRPRTRKPPIWRAFLDAGGGTRTPDTRIMIATREGREGCCRARPGFARARRWTQLSTEAAATALLPRPARARRGGRSAPALRRARLGRWGPRRRRRSRRPRCGCAARRRPARARRRASIASPRPRARDDGCGHAAKLRPIAPASHRELGFGPVDSAVRGVRE